MSSSRAPRGLDVNRGIVVDDGLQTSIAGIHAIGECAEHRGVCYGLVEPAYEQARVLARRLAGERPRSLSPAACSRPISRSPASTCSRPAISSARPAPRRSCSPIPASTPTRSSSSRDDRLVGAVLFGDTADGLWYLDLIRSGASIERDPQRSRVRPRAGRAHGGVRGHVRRLHPRAEALSRRLRVRPVARRAPHAGGAPAPSEPTGPDAIHSRRRTASSRPAASSPTRRSSSARSIRSTPMRA